eukprot:m.34750 g.34750  ORF g.34750 m.34750 type:complete len:363 (+) comp7366_c0_seq1:698-1786(+)
MVAPHSILASALPIFLTLAVVEQGARHLPESGAMATAMRWATAAGVSGASERLMPIPTAAGLETGIQMGLTVAVGGVASASWGKCPPLDLLAGVAATVLGVGNGSVVAALVAAAVATVLVQIVLAVVAAAGLPSTPASIVACGVATVGGAAAAALSAGPGLAVTSGVRWLIATALEGPVLLRVVFGAATGVFTFAGASHGMYHRVVLPLILLEMETQPGGLAFFGALDLCCLCMTSAGVCLAAWTGSRARFGAGDARLGKFGALQTLLVGDFIESAEPFVARVPAVWWASTVASGVAGAVLAKGACKCTAYLPLPAAVGMGDCAGAEEAGWRRGPIVVAVLVCLGLPYLATALGQPRNIKQP